MGDTTIQAYINPDSPNYFFHYLVQEWSTEKANKSWYDYYYLNKKRIYINSYYEKSNNRFALTYGEGIMPPSKYVEVDHPDSKFNYPGYCINNTLVFDKKTITQITIIVYDKRYKKLAIRWADYYINNINKANKRNDSLKFFCY